MRWRWRNVSMQNSFALSHNFAPGVGALQVVSGIGSSEQALKPQWVCDVTVHRPQTEFAGGDDPESLDDIILL